MYGQAMAALDKRGFAQFGASPLYRSPAWPLGSGAPDYLNGMLIGEWAGSAESLLETLLSVETQLGRTRAEPNAPRTVDLDLIDFGGQVIDSPSLTLPHPRMADRAFVLLPLRDVAPAYVHPDGRSIDALLAGVDTRHTRVVGG